MRAACLAGLVLSFALPLQAEPLNEKAARKQLFKSKVEFLVAEDGGLSEKHLGYFRLLFGAREHSADLKRFRNYYGALTISPTLFDKLERGEFQMTGEAPVQFAQGYHSIEAAEAAAIASCNKARASGDAKCVVAARLLPKNWEPRDLMMSVAATENFKLYRKADTPKAFAISSRTQGFGLAEGEGAVDLAIDACNAMIEDGGKPDCVVAVQD